MQRDRVRMGHWSSLRFTFLDTHFVLRAEMYGRVLKRLKDDRQGRDIVASWDVSFLPNIRLPWIFSLASQDLGRATSEVLCSMVNQDVLQG